MARRRKFIFLLLLPALLAAGPATKPASLRDTWAAAAFKTVETGTLPALAAMADEELSRAPLDIRSTDLDRPIVLGAFREFGRYFARLGPLKPDQKQTLQWLARQPRLLPALMTAVTDADAPADVLAVLAALRAADPDRLDEYSELTTAICVVWDAPPAGGAKRIDRSKPNDPKPATSPAKGPDPATAVARFKYFSDPKANLVGNFKLLPWQVAVHAVDLKVTDDEIRWAQQTYGGRRVLSKIYFEVPYDRAAFASGARKADSLPYTLPNIRKYGGVCLDQAYFAANVGKALGCPSAICVGQSGSQGELHAWIGFLQVARATPQGQSGNWNFYEGRYGDMMFWTGVVEDPQTGAKLTDADTCLLSELTRSSITARQASLAMCKLADRFQDDQLPALYMKAVGSPGTELEFAL